MKLFLLILKNIAVIILCIGFGFICIFIYEKYHVVKPKPTLESLSAKMDSSFFAYKEKSKLDSLKITALETKLDSLNESFLVTSNKLDSLSRSRKKSPNKLPLR